MVASLSVALLVLLSAAPALAGEAGAVPEASNLTLVALGIAGLLIGRRAASKRRRD